MDDSVLKENKLEAYAILKILKYCTGSVARSYQRKVCYVRSIQEQSIDGIEEVGAAIKEIINYQTIRGKFSSVHPELRREGITKIEVGKEGLRFLRDSGEKRRFTKRKY